MFFVKVVCLLKFWLVCQTRTSRAFNGFTTEVGNMKKWNRTVMTWECYLGLETDIEVDDMPKESKKPRHTIHTLRATSLPGGRRALVEIDIRRCVVSPNPDKRAVILERFNRLQAGDVKPVFLSGLNRFESVFQIAYSLPSGEQFCDWALDYVRRFLEVFVIDNPNKHRQAAFQIAQQTFVFHDEKWVDFAWWLREIRHGLPPMYAREEAEIHAVLT